MDNEEAPELCDYAFPMIAHPDPQYGGRIVGQRGMTLRDYFAVQALTTMRYAADAPHVAARIAYEIADAMLKARDALGEKE